MPFNNQNDEEEEDPTFDQVAGMADRLGLKGTKRDGYIREHMEGLGYVSVQSRESFVRPSREDDPDGGGSLGSRYGFGRSARQNRQDRDDPDRY